MHTLPIGNKRASSSWKFNTTLFLLYTKSYSMYLYGGKVAKVRMFHTVPRTKKAHLARNCSYFISPQALNHPGQFLG